jgi:hypothetical protein
LTSRRSAGINIRVARIPATFIAIAFIAVTAGTRNQSSNYPIERVRTSAKDVAYFGGSQQALGIFKEVRAFQGARTARRSYRGGSGESPWASAREGAEAACPTGVSCAEFGSLFLHISISLPIEGVPASLGPGLGNRELGENGFLRFVPTKYPFRAMSETPRKNTKIQLALALAQGIPAVKWARANEVPRKTAHRWANDPLVRKAVESFYQGSFNHGMRGMTRKRIKSDIILRSIPTLGWLPKLTSSPIREILDRPVPITRYPSLGKLDEWHGVQRTSHRRKVAAPFPCSSVRSVRSP